MDLQTAFPMQNDFSQHPPFFLFFQNKSKNLNTTNPKRELHKEAHQRTWLLLLTGQEDGDRCAVAADALTLLPHQNFLRILAVNVLTHICFSPHFLQGPNDSYMQMKKVQNSGKAKQIQDASLNT